MIKKYHTDNKIGLLKRKIFKILQEIYGFDIWHIEPVNFRPYAISIINTLSKKINNDFPIVELGCGLGEIIGAIDIKNKKYGYDLSASVLKASQILHPNIKFTNGSFQDIEIGNIGCFIMVNFIHGIKPDDLKEQVDKLIIKNDIDMFVIDVIRNSTRSTYKYEHQGDYLFGEKYCLYKRSKGFQAAGGARRYIEYWIKVNSLSNYK